MKYIIFDSPSNGIFPVVFPEMIDHSMIACSIRTQYPGIKVISAGFCSYSNVDNQAYVWGGSVSLQMQSNVKEDVCWLTKFFNNE